MTKSGIHVAASSPSRDLNVDMDCCPMDVLVVDPITGCPLGCPQLMTVQDRGTRMILGVYTNCDVPFAASPRCTAVYGYQNNGDPGLAPTEQIWSFRGIPKWFVGNNGREFHPKSLTATKHGLDLIHTPIGVRPSVEWYARRARRPFCRGRWACI